VATLGDLCEHHARLADELGREPVVNGSHTKPRSARQRIPVVAETEPLTSQTSALPSAVRPALALAAAEEVETIRRVLLEAATNTTRESWATCTCPECGKSFRQEISVPDHGARIKAVETLLREGLGRVGEAAATPALTLPRDQAEAEVDVVADASPRRSTSQSSSGWKSRRSTPHSVVLSEMRWPPPPDR
jgi:hypothetical protein